MTEVIGEILRVCQLSASHPDSLDPFLLVTPRKRRSVTLLQLVTRMYEILGVKILIERDFGEKVGSSAE